MADEPINIVLEHLRTMRADMHEVKDILREHGSRLTRIEITMAGIRREQANDAENSAHLEARVDRLYEELERVKRRLEIIE
jgi:hypothetical protein